MSTEINEEQCNWKLIVAVSRETISTYSFVINVLN